MRWRLLTHPVFTGSVALLAVNDHVLKARWRGLITGKLSDIAGVIMIAIAFTAITSRATLSIRFTAVAFTLLKTWPPVAAWAAPLLGGVTRTDPTDLIALFALIPLHRWLRQDRSSPGVALLWPAAVVLALSTTTATSCEATPQTRELWSANGQLYASGTSGEEFSHSSDGGRTWTRGGRTSADPHPAPLTEACAKDTCFRALPDVGIDQKVGQAEWKPILRYTAEQRKRLSINISTACVGDVGRPPYFSSLEVSDLPDGTHVTVNMGAGLLHRSPDGSWSRPKVVFTSDDFERSLQFPAVGPPTGASSLGLLALMLAGAGFLVLVVPRFRRPPRRGLFAGWIAFVGGGVLAGTYLFVSTFGDGRLPGIHTAVGSVVVFVISAIVYSTKRKAVPQPPWPAAPPASSWPNPWPPGPPASSWPPPPRR
jgi:hypothetical protein